MMAGAMAENPATLAGNGCGSKRPTFSLRYGLVVSLLVHAPLVLPVFFFKQLVPVVRHQQLVVELFGGLDKQPPGQAAKVEARPAARAPVRRSRASAPPERPPLDSAPIRVAAPLVATEQQAGAVVEPPPVPDGSAAKPGGEVTTVARHGVSPVDNRADAIREYLAALKKIIQSRLIYPPEARRAGYTGTPEIRFKIAANGDIEAGSLVVFKSSGHAALDDNALLAARSCAPLAPPPQPMRVAIAVSFVEEQP